ncbi:MAG: phosphate acyltransferase PlsX [Gemmatimonadota bacterium]|nr:phosphate acyltransferase PlsX [Gemmatimonadota bacterium]
MRIALDAMGGDHAPHAPISGALLALPELGPAHSIQLVGATDVITARLEELLRGDFAHLRAERDRVMVIDAPEMIEMGDKPLAAIRSKPRSSMVVGLKLQPSGDSDAFVSAGNTGAQMAASIVLLRLHAGLSRPAISTLLPTVREPIVLVDSGANVDTSSEELCQFARLGSVYAEDILGRTNPSVALLNIGEEEEKGSAAVKKAYEMLRQSDLNFQGNIEGRDIVSGGSNRGPVDVLVCDGFVGNVLLKFYESVAALMSTLMVREGLDRGRVANALRGFDYSDYGGAPLLGVRGVSIISHGSSSPRALKNAILVAQRAVESRMNEHIGRRLQAAESEIA